MEGAEAVDDKGLDGSVRYGLLAPEAHLRTRPLYEQCFPEDEKRFVDYYYEERASRNEIFAAWKGDRVLSMLHLNPVRLCCLGEELTIPYIVAVATDPAYRRQGLMGRLMNMALERMERNRVPFTFLMPAKESIYRPFGFQRAWTWQWEDELQKQAGETAWVKAEDCTDELLGRLADSVNRQLEERFWLYARRDAAYYRDLAKQQRASGGELLVRLRGGNALCAVCTARESFPPMMTRLVDREAFAALTRGREIFSRAFVCEVV